MFAVRVRNTDATRASGGALVPEGPGALASAASGVGRRKKDYSSDSA